MRKNSVLIAQLDDKSNYAVEYDSPGLCVIFKLGSWVPLAKIHSIAIISRPLSRPHNRAASVSVVGDDPFVETDGRSKSSKISGKKRLAIELLQEKVKRPSIGTSPFSEHPPVADLLRSASALVAASEETVPNFTLPIPNDIHDANNEPTPSDVMENIRTQYLETLYQSKASTAYFAKGPLSRARAVLGINTAEDAKNIIEFLTAMVLPVATLEKKYRNGMTETITTLENGDFSDQGKLASKKRAAIKLGRNGLYTTEQDLIKQWWENYDPATEVPGTSREARKRNRLAELRIRETQLQIILILETLALEKLPPLPKPAPELDLPGQTPTPTSRVEAKDEQKPNTTKGKSKKPKDPMVIINIHLDKLCIWQSVTAETSKDAIESVETVAETDKPAGAPNAAAADALKDFCVEVINPFFAPRLPGRCDMICKKLGGPRITPSARMPANKPSDTASSKMPAPRPGAATKRAEPRQSLRTLRDNDRAQSRQPSLSRRQSRAISLMRSATAPIFPGLKREASETPSLSSIPATEKQGLLASRAGIASSRKFSQREIDMSFSSLIDPALKKANIDNELKDAISALKRPNRHLAGQSMVELAEKRALATTSQSRKSKKPVRNPLFDDARGSAGVLIKATPKVARHKDVRDDPALPQYGHGHSFEREPSLIPPSSISMIPSSGARRHSRLGIYETSVLKATPAERRPLNGTALDATPTRRPSSVRSMFEGSIRATPARAESQPTVASGFGDVFGGQAVGNTPERPQSNRVFFSGAMHTSRTRLQAPPSSSPPKRQSANELAASADLFRAYNPFETPQKVFATPAMMPASVMISTTPMNQPDFGSKQICAVPESPTIQSAVVVETCQSSQPDIYKVLGWDDDDDDL